ncbi:hypothetical protein BC939DRAFT_465382 [Gamsiella multidivaricata]|uniref:uncharacterized protein n=1 Tax=Gamsiella multidivaricata TaxID=101098 RepID=UPI00221EF1B6|nr:uncharacterized protein BC939DRAFT_465382 [Gamsiella multidivaricata]KAI7817636.1 hypothetical protein BC939DRAFT_465382 [Gamsiella multidivaricata]
MDVTARNESDIEKMKCSIPPCEYFGSASGMRQHKSDYHTKVTVSHDHGSFHCVGVPVFSKNKPELECSQCQEKCSNRKMFKKHASLLRCPWFATENGLKQVADLTKDQEFGAIASNFLKNYCTDVGDETFVDDESFSYSVLSCDEVVASLEVQGSEDSSCHSPSQREKRSSSPLPSFVTKRLNMSAQLVKSRYEEGIFRLDVKFSMSGRDLGVRDVGTPKTPAEGLLSLLSDSPNVKLIESTSWIEFPTCQRLPKEWDDIVSGCWLEKPILNYATAVLFAGCVLFNPQDRNAILCLVAETYGRDRDVDVHCEKPVRVGEEISPVSQPLTSGSYPHATVCRIQHDKNDFRLVIGCKVFNVLFTQVWRLSKDSSFERAFTAGCCSSAFPLFGRKDIKIFVDKRSFDLASDIVSGVFTPRFEVENLRQIRSRLCSTHSFRMGRASSHIIANMVSAKVASIFTLSLVSQGSGDGCLVSSFLGRIAKEVNARGREAVLKKEFVLDLLGEVKNEKDCLVPLREILNLFKDKHEISILGNNRFSALENLLNSLAGFVSTKLRNCNEKVVVPLLKHEMSELS